MKRAWETDDLIEHWTVTPQNVALLERKTGHTRLGFALLLKAFQYAGRFPEHKNAIPSVVVAHVASQIGVASEEYLQYDWLGRSIEYHRAQIHAHLGFRAATVQDAEELVRRCHINVYWDGCSRSTPHLELVFALFPATGHACQARNEALFPTSRASLTLM